MPSTPMWRWCFRTTPRRYFRQPMTPRRCGTRSWMRSQGLTSHWTRVGWTAPSAPLATSPIWSPHLWWDTRPVLLDWPSDAATELGLAPAEVTSVRRAGLIHDIGRVAIDPRTWQKNSSLNADEWEQVRLHAYHTERVFNRSPLLAPVAAVACRHHERMDGSGYHRGLNATSLEPASRLLAAADAFHAMTEPRDHRPPMPSAEAAAFLRRGIRGRSP